MRKLFKLNYLALILTALAILVSCGTVTKMIGNVAGSLLTGSTSDLNKASVSVYFMRNVFPKATGAVETDYFEEAWKDGANMVYVSLLDREGMGMLKVDGQVIIDGEVVPHLKNGFYGKWLEADDISPKKVVIKTSSGQEVSFTVSPPPPIHIRAINGKRENGVVDITKPLHLQLDAIDSKPGEEFSIALLGNVMGLTAFLDYGIFKYKKDITLPAAIWMNSASAIMPREGKNWFRIERYKVDFTDVKGVGATQIVGQALDCVPVTITGELDETIFGTVDNQGIRIDETLTDNDGNMKVSFNKPNAYLGRPMATGKKFALASFTLRATKLKQSRTSTSTSTQYFSTHKITTTTTTTETRTFPTLPDKYWDQLVSNLYHDMERILKKNYNIELIPVKEVLRAPSYAELHPIENKVSVVEVEKSYMGTKNLIPTTLSEIIGDISTTFAADRKDSRLIRELGVDGLIAVTIDLEMPWDSFSLTPRMSIRMSGGPNGYKAGPTIYLQGVISGRGVELEKAKMNAKYVMDVLPKVIRQDALMKAFDFGLKKIKSEEKKKDYNRIWALK